MICKATCLGTLSFVSTAVALDALKYFALRRTLSLKATIRLFSAMAALGVVALRV